MRRALALNIIALTSILVQSPTSDAEGHVSDLQAQPLDAARVSQYVEARGAKAATAKTAAEKSAKQHDMRAATKTSPMKSIRPPVSAKSARSSDFWFFDAGSLLLADRDDD